MLGISVHLRVNFLGTPRIRFNKCVGTLHGDRFLRIAKQSGIISPILQNCQGILGIKCPDLLVNFEI